MKTLMVALFSLFFFLPPSPVQAEEAKGIGGLLGEYLTHRADTRSERKAAEKRRNSALKRREYIDNPGFESAFEKDEDNSFSRKRKKSYFEETKPDPDDRYIKLKRPKRTTPEFDTWGRDGGQHTTSEEVLQHMMSPAKK